MSFHLMRPEWLWALLPAAILAALLWQLRNRSGNWSSVIAPELLPYLVGEASGQKKHNLAPAIFVLWLLATVAAAGPSFNKIPQPVHQKQDALVLVLDLSYSMTATDLAPSRIDRARQKLLELLEQRREGQTGLIAYAGDAHIVTPLTDDTPTIANLLPALHPRIMPVPGSDPVSAITLASELLHSAGIRQGRVLLLTDGIEDADRNKLSRIVSENGIALSVMGIGTATGSPLPLPRGGFLKDDNGTIVMPGLDEAALRQLAADSNGRYRRMQIDDSDLDYLLAESGLALPEQTLALDRSADAWEDQGYLLVLLLLLPVLALFRRGWVICLLPLLMLPQAQRAEAGWWDDLWLTRDQQGQRALQQEDNASAAQLFEHNDWAATAAYRDGDYEGAAEGFAAGDTADAWYNRGNALARAGQIDEAIDAYTQSLQREPERTDAEENLALLEQMKQQQQEQQQQQSGEQQDQQQDQQENQDGEQQQDQQQAGNQDQQQPSGQQQDDAQSQQEQNRQQGQDEQQDQQPGEQSEQAAEQQAQQQQTEAGEQDEQTQEQASAAQAQQGDSEQDQAMEQWLRRVPDDPSGLLREKFRYESRQRQRDGTANDDRTYW
jgi:Ca-activated chloride channel homolog